MHQGTCVTHVLWCMPGSLTSGFLWSRWRGKRSRHSRRMRNPHYYVSGKRPMASQIEGNPAVFSTACSGDPLRNQGNIIDPHHWPFVTDINRWTVVSDHPSQWASKAESVPMPRYRYEDIGFLSYSSSKVIECRGSEIKRCHHRL